MNYQLTENNVIEITADPGDNWTGKTYGRETVEHPDHGTLLRCGSVKIGRKRQTLHLRLADKPELSALVEKMVATHTANEAAKKQAERDYRNAIDNSDENITVRYHDGEYLTGYQVTGYAAEKLSGLDLATYVSGWGYLVEQDVIDSLGESFTLSQATEYAQPALEAKAKAKANRDAKDAAHIAACIEEAKKTGSKVVLTSWTEECDDDEEECNLDHVTQWIDSAGNTTLTRQHTW